MKNADMVGWYALEFLALALMFGGPIIDWKNPRLLGAILNGVFIGVMI